MNEIPSDLSFNVRSDSTESLELYRKYEKLKTFYYIKTK